MSEQVAEVTENEIEVTKGSLAHPSSSVSVAGPAGSIRTLAATSAGFTRDAFEDALDKVARPVKGKYADVPYSSEDLIRDKRAEVELEDR